MQVTPRSRAALPLLFCSLTLAACSETPLQPSADYRASGEPVALLQDVSPTIATLMGPFEPGSGCSLGGFGSLYTSAAFDINEDGVAVGNTPCVAGEVLTFRWSEAQGMEQLANFPGGYAIAGAQSINNRGTIAGVFFPQAPLPRENNRPVLWTATNSRIDLAPVTTCYDYSQPWCNGGGSVFINDYHAVTGTYIEGAYRWTAATGLVYLPILGSRSPTGINSLGDIIAAPEPGGSSAALLHWVGFLLHRRNALLEIPGIWPTSLNDWRQVVGYSGTWPNLSALIWTQGRGLQPLGTLAGGTSSIAYDINNRGEVVGASIDAAGESRAFYWTAARGMVDLGPGIAYAINNAGDIVGTGPGLVAPGSGRVIWQATLWRGTAGVQLPALALREGKLLAEGASDCFKDELNWQSKPRMLRCLSEQ